MYVKYGMLHLSGKGAVVFADGLKRLTAVWISCDI